MMATPSRTSPFEDACQELFEIAVGGIDSLFSWRPVRKHWPMLKAKQTCLWDPIPFGRDTKTRKLIEATLVGHHMLVGGESGGGKSVFLSMVCAAAALDPMVRMHCLDAKRLELAVWEPVSDAFVGPEMDAAIRVLHDLRKIINERQHDLLAIAVQEQRPVRRIRQSHGLPIHVLVIDELAEYTEPKTKEAAEFSSLLRSLVSLGRACGVIVVAATQKPQANVVPSELRDLFQYRLALRCATPPMSDVILGQGWAAQGVNAAKIPSGSPGNGLLLAEGALPRPIKTFNLTDDDLAMLARRARRLRQEKGGS